MRISLSITRNARHEFVSETTLAGLKREVNELASWLFRETTFSTGALLMTGTGSYRRTRTLASGDVIGIAIEGIGKLRKPVA